MSNKSVFATLGASNHSAESREENDYYATDPIAIQKLLEFESFNKNIWECACGEGHLSIALQENGYNVKSTDIVDRGFGRGGIDFLKCDDIFEGDICTNPPYKFAEDFVEHAIRIVPDGSKIAMFLRLQFLEGKRRRKLFDAYPPMYIYVSSSRINCCKNGDFSDRQRKNNSAQAYGWFIWRKGYIGDTIVRWFN